MLITAARRADYPTQSFIFFQLLGVVLLISAVITSALSSHWVAANSGYWS
jgi:hypothetical protein